MSAPRRSLLLVTHTGRRDIRQLSVRLLRAMNRAGFQVRLNTAEANDLAQEIGGHVDDLGDVMVIDGPECTAETEVALVLGGDGTFLRAAEDAWRAGVPLLGVNLGHVGFLAETELDSLDDTVHAIVERRYEVEQRLCLQVSAEYGGEVIARDWALNEASVEKSAREKMLEIAVSVDDRPLLRFGCDGLICATPTGSTAYAFSVGGPVIWPDVEAMLVIPNAAHALFERPLVVAPTAMVRIDLLGADHPGVLSCDGRRLHDLPSGSQVLVQRSPKPVLIARPHPTPFGERLVAKFQLPVRSFREGGPANGMLPPAIGPDGQ